MQESWSKNSLSCTAISPLPVKLIVYNHDYMLIHNLSYYIVILKKIHHPCTVECCKKIFEMPKKGMLGLRS